MARPKGSGRGLVRIGTRIEPTDYEALTEWRFSQADPETGGELSEADAVRQLLGYALEKLAGKAKKSAVDAGYAEGLRRGRADYHKAMNTAWDLVNKERGE